MIMNNARTHNIVHTTMNELAMLMVDLPELNSILTN